MFYFPLLLNALAARRFTERAECRFDSAFDAALATPLEVLMPFFDIIYSFFSVKFHLTSESEQSKIVLSI